MPKKDRLLIKREIETYARTLHEKSKEKDLVFESVVEIETVRDIIDENPALRAALDDETLPEGARSAILAEVFSGYPGPLVEILSVMAERGDMYLLHRVIERQQELAEEVFGIVVLEVTTAVELDDALREAIKSKYAAYFGKEVMLRENVDPSIVGGIILGAHGKRIDASTATKLEQLRVALSSVKTGGER